MIRWCSFCQRFLGELVPYDDPEISHGICLACEARLTLGDSLIEDTQHVRALVAALVDCARRADEALFDGCVADARRLGYDTESLLLALLQPALYQAGRAWALGTLSVAAEHRMSRWCERVLATLQPTPQPGPLGLLILQAPGNTHTIGPRIAAHVLAARGVAVLAIVHPLTFAQMVVLVTEHRPAIVGFSCSLAAQVPAVVATIAGLRDRLEPGLCCRYVLSGMAFRQGALPVAPSLGPGVEVVLDLSAIAPPTE